MTPRGTQRLPLATVQRRPVARRRIQYAPSGGAVVFTRSVISLGDISFAIGTFFLGRILTHKPTASHAGRGPSILLAS